jgi:hypothetical protein
VGVAVGVAVGVGVGVGVAVGEFVGVAVGVLVGVGVGVGVFFGVAVGVLVGVAVGVGVGQIPMSCRDPPKMLAMVTALFSYAPISTTSTNLGKPRWSPVNGRVVCGLIERLLLPAFMAGLQGIKECVKVLPPLSANGPNRASTLSKSEMIQPVLPNASPIRLVPSEMNEPETSSSLVDVDVLPAMIVLRSLASFIRS